MICPPDKPFCLRSLVLIAAGWFLVALFIGETELLSLLPGPAAQITLATLTAGLFLAFWASRSLRSCLLQIDLRALIMLHLVRFVGIYFLVLHARGQLPGRFAVLAGWGDIIVATGAAMLLTLPHRARTNFAVLAWNSLGFADIILVVFTAATLAFAERDSMSALTRLPLSFLPTMIVPLIIASHAVIFYRLLRKTATPATEPTTTTTNQMIEAL